MTMADEDVERSKHSSYLLGTFTIPYFRMLYSAYEGDLLLPFVLGEIGMHNVGLRYEGAPGSEENRKRLRPCNALSISTVTGIPRETVRRKVEILVKMGLIERDEAGHLRATQLALEHSDRTNAKGLELMLEASRRVQSLHGQSTPIAPS